MGQLNRLFNSLHSLEISLLHIRTPHHRLLSPTTSKSLLSAVSRAAFSSCAPGGHQIDPVRPAERTILLEGLSKNLVVLTCNSADGRPCHVYMVGTVHVSQDSWREVRDVINIVKPQAVFLELCASRKAVLTRKNFKVPTAFEMIDLWKKKRNLFGIVYSWYIAMVANELKVLPGLEFRVAFEEAGKLGSQVYLGDRPITVTLQRTWGTMNFWQKTKLVCTLSLRTFNKAKVLKEAVKNGVVADVNRNDLWKHLTDNDEKLAELLQEMSEKFPTFMEALVDERDQYMASTLLTAARNHHRVVAVVGKGHLRGIEKYWLQPIDEKKLLKIPSASAGNSTGKMFKSVGVAGLGVAIATGIYLAAKTWS